jgi:hypothetical protein
MLAGLEMCLVKYSRAKTAKPQTTVSRKGAKNAKDAKNVGWAGDVLG